MGRSIDELESTFITPRLHRDRQRRHRRLQETNSTEEDDDPSYPEIM
jgi:hypothetical protein